MEYQKHALRPFWVRYWSENDAEMQQNEDDLLATLEQVFANQDAEAFNDLLGEWGQALHDLPSCSKNHRIAKAYFKLSAFIEAKAIQFLQSGAMLCSAKVKGRFSEFKAVVGINIRYSETGEAGPVFAVYAGKSTAYFDSLHIESLNEVANAIKAMSAGYTEGIEELF